MAIENVQQPKGFGPISTSDLIFKFILLDVLFFPYPPELPMTFGVIAGTLWPLLCLRHANARYLIFSAGLIVFSILSFMRFLAFSEPSSSIYLVTNFINLGILCFMAILALMITSHRDHLSFMGRNKYFILRTLKVYVVFKSILAVIFIASPAQYFSIRSFWTFSANTIQIDELNILTRFTGTLSDPNNFSCILTAVVAFIIFRQSEKLIQNIVLLLLASLSIVASMSVTGTLAFTLIVMVYILGAKLPGRTGTKFALRLVVIISTPLIFLAIFQLTQDNVVVQLALQRVTESSAESRYVKFEILADFNKVFGALLLGEGATIIWRGDEFRPHIGHLYIFLGFGLPVYIIFLFAFFPLSFRKPLGLAMFLLPIFLGFSLNVGLYEPRFATLWAILASVYFIEPVKSGRAAPLMAKGKQSAHSPLGGSLV